LAPTHNNIPANCTVLVIGGGPAGSSVATYLAQSGIDVIVLEKAAFPRNQVGESLIPNFWKFTDLLGVTEKIEQEGFVVKSGGIFAWNGKIRQVKFSNFGYSRPGLHVERDRFDQILLDHAESCGAAIYNQVAVKHVDFSDPLKLKVSFLDKRVESNTEGTIHCQYIIDASGHSAFLAGQMNTRQTVSSSLNFLSIWGYYTNSRYLGVDRQSHSSENLKKIPPVTFVMSHADGWLWHIVLREKTSVGLIVHTDKLKGLNKSEREVFFQRTCKAIPYLDRLLASASFIKGSLEYRPDYSYFATRIASENYYCIGDAAAFVDPIFSHGVQNAFYNANICAIAVKESLKNNRNRTRYSQLYASRMQQFYSFSRALALGDYGCNGVNRELVKPLMKAMTPLEIELLFLVSQVTNRSENFTRLAKETGIWNGLESAHSNETAENINLAL
jgi:flavin-dependent dehydrogenase